MASAQTGFRLGREQPQKTKYDQTVEESEAEDAVDSQNRWMIARANKFMNRILLIISFLVSIAGIGVGQTPAQVSAYAADPGAKVETLQLDSRLMGRKMPYRVVLPIDYSDIKNSAKRYPTIYLLHGLTGHFNNWTDRTKLNKYATDYKFIIVTPEGDNGWYTDSVTKASDKYESYIVKDLINEIDAKFRTQATREGRIIAGLSMGGYGAVKFGIKYPEIFSIVGTFSGALGATSFTSATSGASIGGGIDAIFGPADSETRRANDVFKLVRELTAEKQKAMPFIYQSCGTEDFLYQSNRDFMAAIADKKLAREYRESPGRHDWVFWDEQVRQFLSLVNRRLPK
jgi:S-formylglutathione hydrolase FrmB